MEAVDVARIRTQVRLAELALVGLMTEPPSAIHSEEPAVKRATDSLIQAANDLNTAVLSMGLAVDALNEGKPPRERG